MPTPKTKKKVRSKKPRVNIATHISDDLWQEIADQIGHRINILDAAPTAWVNQEIRYLKARIQIALQRADALKRKIEALKNTTPEAPQVPATYFQKGGKDDAGALLEELTKCVNARYADDEYWPNVQAYYQPERKIIEVRIMRQKSRGYLQHSEHTAVGDTLLEALRTLATEWTEGREIAGEDTLRGML